MTLLSKGNELRLHSDSHRPRCDRDSAQSEAARQRRSAKKHPAEVPQPAGRDPFRRSGCRCRGGFRSCIASAARCCSVAAVWLLYMLDSSLVSEQGFDARAAATCRASAGEARRCWCSSGPTATTSAPASATCCSTCTSASSCAPRALTSGSSSAPASRSPPSSARGYGEARWSSAPTTACATGSRSASPRSSWRSTRCRLLVRAAVRPPLGYARWARPVRARLDARRHAAVRVVAWSGTPGSACATSDGLRQAARAAPGAASASRSSGWSAAPAGRSRCSGGSER